MVSPAPTGPPAAGPLNRETPLASLAESLTPSAEFYERSNLEIPRLDTHSWRLSVEGCVERPQSLTWPDLQALPRHSLAVTLECAGNGRSLMKPLPPGTPWGLGAVGTAEFCGPRLRDVLEQARPSVDAVEALFEGADRGCPEPGRETGFARSLPLDAAMDSDVLLAVEMNGEPLAPEHGYPLRLVVPGWYGVASVKWLTRVRLLARPFRGFFQGERYVYRGEPGTPDGTLVTRMRVRSLIVGPADGDRLPPDAGEVHGIAWSGSGPVTRVEVSVDGGGSWVDARLDAPDSPHAAVRWRLEWRPDRRGEHVLLARATDAAGNVQPLQPVWNELGYGNNGVQRVRVSVA